MNDVFKISKDIERANSLLEIAIERKDIIKILPRDKPYKIIEEYYEIILELLTAVMYCDGQKTLSHKTLIEYYSKNYSNLEQHQIKLIDQLRKHRNNIVYYGKKVKIEFLINNENEIKNIIKILEKIVKEKIKE